TLVLTITPNTNNTTTESACGSFTWSVNGTTYTQSGTFTSVNGCATETLVLTVIIPGTACNDGNSGTINDTLDQNCNCVGTPIGGGCTLNELFLEIQTDGISETTWEFVTSGTAVVVASGGSQYAGPGVLNESVCLADGCYDLRVFDDAGDGIAGGGYTLRNSAGDRIIDNRNNFTAGALSAVGNGPSAFCVPIGTQNLVWSSRDKLDWVEGQYLVAEANAAVSAVWIQGGANNVQSTNTGYQFWIFDPNGSFSFRRFRSHATSDNFGPASATRAARMKINYWLAPIGSIVPENVLMNVRVRTRVNGINGNWGPASRFKIDPVRAQCPLTQLNDTPGNAFLSCGQTREFGPGNFVWARPVTGANRYQFRFRLEEEGFEYVVTSNTFVLQLNWNSPALEAGRTYDVDVRVSRDFGATWCTEGASWGESCTITIVGESAIAGRTKELDITSAEMSLWPNPNNGDQLWLNLSGVEDGVKLVAVEIIDLNGKRVADRMVPVSGANVDTRLELEGQLGSGVYIVRVVAGSSIHTERLVIAR
ncbi:MAG: T9SS type A sorting domain-containing protein, partial [Flavobacteriales bacterium]